jgi:hypothetical protein
MVLFTVRNTISALQSQGIFDKTYDNPANLFV